jgi:PAS domain S-box-containing protein
MSLSQELALLREQLEAEKRVRLRAERLLRERTAELKRLSQLSPDSTDMRVIDAKLKEQRVFFEAILNRTPSDIIVTDPGYRYLFVNESAVPDADLRRWMIGKTNEEYCQRSGRGEETAAKRREQFDKALRTKEKVQWEEKIPDSRGVLQHYLRRIHPVLDSKGAVEWLIIYSVNITERMEVEEKLGLSEKRYRDIFNYSQALICTHDMTGRLLGINPSISRTLGYSEAEMLGRKIQEFIPAEFQESFEKEYIRVIRDKENTINGVFCVLSKNGERIYLLYKNYRVEERGLEPYVIGFSQDITDRINMEKELRLSKQSADEIAKAKEAFLAHMSHEIRTPMSGILGIASLLRKTSLDSQQQNYLQLIQESANSLLVIVNDILDLEKILAGKLQLEKISFKIVDKIATTIQSFIYKTEEKDLGLLFQNSIPPDMVVKGDPYRLSQVLNNILSNALKFTEAGHITIATAIIEREADWVVAEVTVSDTGIGISKDRIAHIFEPFEQAEAAISRKYGGTGLGLTICKNMIDMQSGELLVESEEGKGSSFTIRIPYQISGEVVIPGNQINEEIDYKSLGRRKVLVAEDVELNQFLARHILESWDFEVVIAGNGREALELVQQQSFDCILMDVQMPEMDGIEATRHIRELNDLSKAGLPIIALTANALKGDSEKYIEAGMNDYLAKPFNEEKLFRVIARNLSPVQFFEDQPILPLHNHTTMLSTGTKLYDLSMVRSVSGGDEGFIKKMVALFIETVPLNLADLRKATDSGNWDQVGKTAHKLKSTIDSMGIKTLRVEIRAVEMNARSGESVAEIPVLVGKIESVIDNCIEQLKADILV